MATVGFAAEDRGVSIGRIIQRALETISSNPLMTFGIAFLLGGLPSLLLRLVMRTIQPQSAVPLSASGLGALWGAVALSSLAGIVLFSVVQAALIRATAAHSEGRKASFGECLSAGLRAFLPVIGFLVLWYVALIVGFVLLIVPGIILMLMWSVAVPAIVEERSGVIASFGRSRFLTKGNRWKIFGLFVLLLVVYLLFFALLGLAGYSVFNPSSATDFSAGFVVGGVVMSTLQQVIWGTIQGSLFVELRDAKEGSSIGQLQEVFS